MYIQYYTPKNYKNIFFSSDFHAFHKNYCVGSTSWSDKTSCRQFKDEYHMTYKLIDNINDTVKSNDVLIHAGDWSFGGMDNVIKFREMIKCERIVNILGNHDKHIRKYKELQSLFEWVGDYWEMRYNKITICVSHYPIGSWNEIGKGAFMLHGHCHHNYKDTKGRMLDIGIDGPKYNFKPISLDYIYQTMINIPIISTDHHTKETNYG